LAPQGYTIPDMRDIIVVAGEDPYKYKGIAELTYPYVRRVIKLVLKSLIFVIQVRSEFKFADL